MGLGLAISDPPRRSDRASNFREKSGQNRSKVVNLYHVSSVIQHPCRFDRDRAIRCRNPFLGQ
jgi:hypothetical protein